jgi:anti-sigma B factor antagonist
MPLQIQERTVEGIVILELDGRLVAGVDSSGLQEQIAQLIGQDHTNILMDMQNVSFIDSTGLGIMIMAYSTVDQAKGQLKLIHLTKRHIQLLLLTKLTTVFEIFNDEQEAINSFFPDREVKKFDILEFVKNQDETEQPG